MNLLTEVLSYKRHQGTGKKQTYNRNGPDGTKGLDGAELSKAFKSFSIGQDCVLASAPAHSTLGTVLIFSYLREFLLL